VESKTRVAIYYKAANGKAHASLFINGLKDAKGKAALQIRIARAQTGNFGDHKPLGDGLFEMRIHAGPGYRLYYGLDGDTLVVVVAAGPKDHQAKDIKRSKALWAEYKGEKRR